MAYSELIKSFERIRGYIREFYVYGFRHRTQIGDGSARSYDNERRRVESWLGDYMRFGQDAEGKRVYLSVDSRKILANPLYKAFKTKSFTDNDVMLHFYLMDLLADGEPHTLKEVITRLEREYLASFEEVYLDESTIRKKLKEYEQLGLVRREKHGRESVYRQEPERVELPRWRRAVLFFSEAGALGVIGSTILDRLDGQESFFRFKHHHIMKALDSEIMYTLLEAIHNGRSVSLLTSGQEKKIRVIPVRLYISTWYGRQYLFGYSTKGGRYAFWRLDRIRRVKIEEKAPDRENVCKEAQEIADRVWGVGLEDGIEHLEFDLRAEAYEIFAAQRLEREKRCGTVTRLDETTWRFSADVASALEILPWVRTFIGRIERFSCSNPEVEKRFFEDLEKMYRLYGLETEDPEGEGGKNDGLS